MSDFREITPDFAVAPQISLADVSGAAGAGYVMIINNRPDGEAADQPTSAAVAAAAAAAGLAYRHIPVVGSPTAVQVRAMRDALAAHPGKTLAFCRSGTRSIITWALGRATDGSMARDELARRAAAAGYDLSAVLAASPGRP